MRVSELDRDMSDVFPTGATPDSEFLFRRMEEVTFEAMGAPRGRALDAAAGVGQDDHALAARGWHVIGAEPSGRMTALARLADARRAGEPRGGGPGEGGRPEKPGSVHRVRAWSESLPFRTGSFDAVFCKGSLDHFDEPLAALAELARIARSDGRVVLAVANFESLGCRAARALEARTAAPRARGRRLYDVPSDHFTRYDARLLAGHAARVLHVERVVGVSLLWGVRPWTKLLARLGPAGHWLLRAADAVARAVPAWSDVIVVAGRPRRSG
jgi:SAM-dependent methyltransferase